MKEKKKKIIILSIAIVAVIAIIAGSTYAYWQITKTQKGLNDMVAACLDITMQNESGTFGLDKAWPISDSEGEALTGYTFEVKNNCDENVNYIVGLNSVEGSSDNYLDYSSLRLKLDDKESSLISDFGDIGYSDPENTETVRDSKLLSMESLEGGGTATHNVKVWIDKDAPVSEQGKIFSGQVFITGGQGIFTPDECFVISDKGSITGYDESCGSSIIVPAKVNNIEVKSLSLNNYLKNGKTVEPNFIVYDVAKWDGLMYEITDVELAISPNGEGWNREYIDSITKYYKKQYCNDINNCNLEEQGIYILDTEEKLLEYDTKLSTLPDDYSWFYDIYIYSIDYDMNLEKIEDFKHAIFSLDLSNATYLETINVTGLCVNDSYSETKINEKCIETPNGKYTNCGEGTLKNLELPFNDKLSTIHSGSFANCSLESVVIPGSVSRIDSRAFRNNKLETVIFESSDSSKLLIDFYAFSGNSISEIELSNNIKTIESGAFRDNQISELVIPASVEILDDSAFAYNKISSLTFEDKLNNPSNLSVIKAGVFTNNNLSTVIIPSSVKEVGYQAFYNNPNLKNVIIKNIEENIKFDTPVFNSSPTVTYDPNYTE